MKAHIQKLDPTGVIIETKKFEIPLLEALQKPEIEPQLRSRYEIILEIGGEIQMFMIPQPYFGEQIKIYDFS